MRLHPWLLVVWLASVSAESHNITRRDASSSKRVVCYYTNWSVYRPGTAKFTPQNINPYLCTHLIYAFGGLNKENGLRPYDKYQDIEQGGYAKFTGLKTYNKQLKTLLAIGGWNEGSARFSSLVADEERRAEFVKNVVRFLRQNHFDGLDLDWEYPAFRDGGKPHDRENYALLVQELREEFEKESEKTGRPRLLLTMAVPAGIEYIDKGYDVPKLNRYLDFMNILSYDYHSAFEPSVNHHAPLYPLEEENEYNFDTQLNIDYTVQHYVKLGADREKLVLGIPTYGRSYTLFNPLATEIGSPADGPGEQGDATREKGYLAYYEICENLKSDEWKVEKPNPKAIGPYAYKGNQWVGYDDEDIVKMKARYVDDNDLGGIMFWSIDNDDFRGKCSGKQYPLIEAGKDAMLLGSGSANEVVPSSSSKNKGRPRPTSIPRNSSNTNRKSGDRNTGRRRKNKSRTSTTRGTTTTTTTTTTPKYSHPQTTPEPPTTPDPGSDFTCKDEGFFPHPRDCKKYFWCLDSGPSNLGIVAHQFTCPSGLFFNKVADSCDYARNVICKKNSKSESGTTTKPPPTTTTAATSTTARFRTTTTTTTTTTTSKPEEEEYEYYDDDDEGVDSDTGDKDDLEEEDPKAIQDLIKLIKKLGGLEQLEKQLHLDEKGEPGTPGGFSRSLYDRVLNRNSNSDKGTSLVSTRSTTSSPATSPRYSTVFRNRPSHPQNEGLENTPHRYDRPDYVTIRRGKPAHKEEDVNEEDDFEEDEEENETEEGKPTGPEYVTIRRQRPEKTTVPDITTPRYVTIQRKRPMNEEEDIVQDESDKTEDDEIASTQKPLKPQRNHFKETVLRDDLDDPPKDVTEKESTTQKVSETKQYVDVSIFRTTTTPSSNENASTESEQSSIYLPSIHTVTESIKSVNVNNKTARDKIRYNKFPVYENINRNHKSKEDLSLLYTIIPTDSTTSTVIQEINTFPVASENSSKVTETTETLFKGKERELSKIQEGVLSERYTTVTEDNLFNIELDGNKKANEATLLEVLSDTEQTAKSVNDSKTTLPVHSEISKGNTKENNIPQVTQSSVTEYTDNIVNEIQSLATESKTIITLDSSENITPKIVSHNVSQYESKHKNNISKSVVSNVDTNPDELPTETNDITGANYFPREETNIEARISTPDISETTTHFTPTVVRVVTSVIESATTERQKIAVNRVPYRILIAAMKAKEQREETTYADLVSETKTITIPTTTLSPNTHTTGRFITRPSQQHKYEKIMEVNRISSVTVRINDINDTKMALNVSTSDKNLETLEPPVDSTEKSLQNNENEGFTTTTKGNIAEKLTSVTNTRKIQTNSPKENNIIATTTTTEDILAFSNHDNNYDNELKFVNVSSSIESFEYDKDLQSTTTKSIQTNRTRPSRRRKTTEAPNTVTEQVLQFISQPPKRRQQNIRSRSQRTSTTQPTTSTENQDGLNSTRNYRRRRPNNNLHQNEVSRRRNSSRYRTSPSYSPTEKSQLSNSNLINNDIKNKISANFRSQAVNNEAEIFKDISVNLTFVNNSIFQNSTELNFTPENILSSSKVSYVPSDSLNISEAEKILTDTFTLKSDLQFNTENKTHFEDIYQTGIPISGEHDIVSILPISDIPSSTVLNNDNNEVSTQTPKNVFSLDEQRDNSTASRKHVRITKRRRRPVHTEGSSENINTVNGKRLENNNNESARNNKNEKDESLATLEDTFRSFVSTDSPYFQESRGLENDNYDGRIFSVKNPEINEYQFETNHGGTEIDISPYLKHEANISPSYSGNIDSPLIQDFRSSSRYNPGFLDTSKDDQRISQKSRNKIIKPKKETFVSNDEYPENQESERFLLQKGNENNRFDSKTSTTYDNRRRKLVKQRRPATYYIDQTSSEEEEEEVKVFTSPRLRQRQPGTLYSPRNRSRATTTTTSTTSTTTDVPLEITTLPSFSRQEQTNQRRVVKRRKFVPRGGGDTTSTETPVLSSTSLEDDVQTTDQPRIEPKTELPASPRRVTFPRRVRPGISTTVTPVINDAQVQPSAVVEETHSLKKKVDEEDEQFTTSDYLPDLANVAVAAITNLATQDTPLSGPVLTTSRSVRPTHRTTVITTEAPVTLPIRQALRPRPFSRISTASRTAPVNTEYRVRPATVRTIAAPVIVDYEYYDDDGGIVNTAPRSNKVKIHSDGYIECLDQGNFPHPFSCKKFISCAKMENGELLGWEYTCPRRLSFDPIGGICNWSAGLGCKE